MRCRERAVVIPQLFGVFFDAAPLFLAPFVQHGGFKTENGSLKERAGSQGLPPCACYSVPCHYTQMAQAEPALLSGGNHNEKNTTICTAGYTHFHRGIGNVHVHVLLQRGKSRMNGVKVIGGGTNIVKSSPQSQKVVKQRTEGQRGEEFSSSTNPKPTCQGQRSASSASLQLLLHELCLLAIRQARMDEP